MLLDVDIVYSNNLNIPFKNCLLYFIAIISFSKHDIWSKPQFQHSAAFVILKSIYLESFLPTNFVYWIHLTILKPIIKDVSALCHATYTKVLYLILGSNTLILRRHRTFWKLFWSHEHLKYWGFPFECFVS